MSTPTPAGRRRHPLLVTGMPRSGTTWLARLCATAPGTSMPGRELMTPEGYALHHTVDGWVALRGLTARQRRLMRLSYVGLNPFTFGRYGRRQLRASLPSTRVVVKDPFAMLSLPPICELTGAEPLVVYRHPGAMLVSYRRMGWQPDLTELRPILREHRREQGTTDGGLPELPLPGEADDATAMAVFWSVLYEIAVDRAADIDGLVVVSHEELSAGGMPAAESLFTTLGLTTTRDTVAEMEHEQPTAATEPSAAAGRPALHDFNRSPAQAAHSWRARLEPGELDRVEAAASDMLARLESLRTRLSS
ncbi:MAG TPA: sulfotransferase [Nocardioides sp.]|nr:sulfotransferase [Nocardioides sp.]